MRYFFSLLVAVIVTTAAAAQTPQAVLFAPGEISTGDYELNAVFSPDGETLYFTKSTPDPAFRLMTILTSERNGDGWSTPRVAPFSGQYSDVDPVYAPDGNRIYYVSQRPIDGNDPKDDFDIWYVDREGDSWSDPKHLGGPVATDQNEYYPAIAADGTLYFSARRGEEENGYDLFRAEPQAGKYGEPVRLSDAVNSPSHEIDVYVDPAERYLIYVSYREGQGRGDLYVSYNRNGEWTQAENLGDAINTPFREFCPMVTPDGSTLFFTSDRSVFADPLDEPLTFDELSGMLHGPGNGLGDIYSIRLDELGISATLASGSE